MRDNWKLEIWNGFHNRLLWGFACLLHCDLDHVFLLPQRKFRPRIEADASSAVAGYTDFSTVPMGQTNTNVKVLLTCVATCSGRMMLNVTSTTIAGGDAFMLHCVSVTRLLNLTISPTSTGRRNETSPISWRTGLPNSQTIPVHERCNDLFLHVAETLPASTEHVSSAERQFKSSFHKKPAENSPAHVTRLTLSHKCVFKRCGSR